MTVPVHPVALANGVGAWFSGRPTPAAPLAVGQPGNLSHRRPHQPSQLAADRREACTRMGLAVTDLHWMRQVHGNAVGVVTDETPAGAELRGVDVLVTDRPGRALVVQVADCVPLLLGTADGVVAAAHAGRRGVAAGVVDTALDAMAGLGADPQDVHAVIGPAIGGCCYEVPADLRDDVGQAHPAAVATTTWGTPSLDLPAAVAATLRAAGVAGVERAGGCTRCDTEHDWFSHRADPDAGRQLGVVVSRPGGGAHA